MGRNYKFHVSLFPRRWSHGTTFTTESTARPGRQERLEEGRGQGAKLNWKKNKWNYKQIKKNGRRTRTKSCQNPYHSKWLSMDIVQRSIVFNIQGGLPRSSTGTRTRIATAPPQRQDLDDEKPAAWENISESILFSRDFSLSIQLKLYPKFTTFIIAE